MGGKGEILSDALSIIKFRIIAENEIGRENNISNLVGD